MVGDVGIHECFDMFDISCMVYCSVFHSHPLKSARFLPEMQLLVFIFGVYESAYWMNDLLVFMQIMI